MFGVRCVIAGFTAAAMLGVLGIDAARADSFARSDDTSLYFAGTDLWGHGGFSYGGILWAPEGLDREGFTFKMLIGSGTYRYLSGALGDATVNGSQVTGLR